MVVSLFSQMALPHLGIIVIHRGSSRIKPLEHGCSSWRFFRLVSLCGSLHWPKLSGTNGLPCMAMSLISQESLRYMSRCSRRSSQGITFKTIMPAFMDFSLIWSCISHIRLILRLNAVIETSLPCLPRCSRRSSQDMITLLIHPNWRPLLSKGRSLTTHACKRLSALFSRST